MATKKTGKRANSEGTIRQRVDGRWEARYSYRDTKGLSRRKSLFGHTQKEVSDKLREARQQQAHGIQPTDDRLTLGKYLAGWLEHVAAPTLKPKTLASYQHLTAKHIVPGLGHWQLTKLDPQTLRKFLTEKTDGLSSRSVQYIHAVIRKSLADALKDGLVVRNVATLVKPPRVKSKPVEPLTPDQVRQFLASVAGDRNEALYTVAVALGLRQGECFALQWTDVDLAANVLHVRHALTRVKSTILLDTPKTHKAVRSVGLPAVAVAALQAHRHRQEIEREFAGDRWQDAKVIHNGKEITVDLVFRSTIGTPLNSANCTHEFQRKLKAAGIPHRRFHDLRHSAATMLLVQGVPARVIQGILGWDQGSMIERYAHLVDEIRQDAAAQMDAILKPVGVTVGVKKQKPASSGPLTH